MKHDAVKELTQQKGCIEIRKIIENNLGSEAAEQIRQNAVQRLKQIHQQYPDIPEGQHVHTSTIFPTAALYLALKEKAPEEAIKWTEEGAKINALRQSEVFKSMVKLPGGKSFFLKSFANIGQKMFGESAGFQNHLIEATKDICRFDILACPYVAYCKELNCPELAHIFCYNDVYAYGDLEGIHFLRTQTLGTGGEKCDFLLKKTEQKELFSEHAAVVLSDWIDKEFGSQADAVRKATIRQYHRFLRSAPDYGGRKSPHANQIYDSFLLLAFCSIDSKPHTLEELEPLSFEMFMSPFHILGKLFNANHRQTMHLLGIIFQKAAEKSNAHAEHYPADFKAEIQPYDKENGIARYCFTRCPIADFAKKHHLGKWMPLMCNCDHTALGMIHAGLIREHTCYTDGICEYCVVSDKNPLMNQYKLVRNQDGLLISRRKKQFSGKRTP